jgi:hypothetical protein
MEKHWLRGLLVGVSLALLLSGGVALAKTPMSFTVDQHCFECCAEGECTPWQLEDMIVPPQRYRVDLTFSDIYTGERLCQRLRFEREQTTYVVAIGFSPPYTGSSCSFAYWMGCAGFPGFDTDCVGLEDTAIHESGAWDISDLYGNWDWWVWQGGECAGVPPESADHFTVRFAEDCAPREEAVEEFVPEPGSLLLLGSGLAGLAGYATLRWRTKE